MCIPLAATFSVDHCVCRHKSRFSHQFHNLAQIFHHAVIVLSLVWAQAARAIFDTVFRIGKITAALISQRIQRAIAKQAAKAFRFSALVTGEIFAPLMLKEIVICHRYTLLILQTFGFLAIMI